MTVFLQHGYAGATVELVVRRARASKATIYSFFGGKEGLFDALIDERAERILAGFPDFDRATVNVRAAGGNECSLSPDKCDDQRNRDPD